ncbi:Siroheme synthase / Precorrin-2 oxidase / Sirohydrochlorin ferrochelatase/ Uroporphyrinogen-III methyltransferase [Moritella sp. JT01]|uniref:precorrin-2 dehydrogenase/sirohydrochlorin ferrochelatase family protein n=1 Tax=Moritella sp. JT01 TaxID=756698 RepID=UPI000792AE36|nr:bifunctional precorrin-2 dehydrogenase/sirohydrochlorin ferrochelatase [Moritella sp. JT01]KXO07405.1 Siroheme synthase / Precorrin-2 oxidase / Sirohydrochlorin ferrochelatase/ Uroporphyrinogen-III methyltransferase [Moritella sp. JT01]
MQYLPIFMDVNNKNVLVVGGGEVASRKVDLLLSACAKVTVLSPRLNDTLQRYRVNAKITVIIDGYNSNYLLDYVMVWVTTDDTLLNKQVWQDCCERNLLVNVADQPELCEFITPSIIDRSPLQIAISSGGASPVLIRYLREKLEALLPETLGQLGTFAGEQRERVKQQFSSVTERRRFWERFFSSKAVTLATDTVQLQQEFDLQLTTPNTDVDGDIYLIQLPDETDLLRLRALRLMQQADVILYVEDGDDSIADFVELCRRDAERYPVLNDDFVVQAQARKQQGERVCLLINNNTQFDLLTTELNAVSVIA